MMMARRSKFKFLDSVRAKNQPNQAVGLVIHASKSEDYGELFWIQWPRNHDSVMHASQLVKEERLKSRK